MHGFIADARKQDGRNGPSDKFGPGSVVVVVVVSQKFHGRRGIPLVYGISGGRRRHAKVGRNDANVIGTVCTAAAAAWDGCRIGESKMPKRLTN